MCTIQTSQGGCMELAYANAPPEKYSLLVPGACSRRPLAVALLQGLPQLLSQGHIIFGNSLCATSGASSFRTSPSWRMCVLSRFSCVQLFATPYTVACQVPLSIEFSRQEYWSGYHALLQEVFLTQGSNPGLLCLLHWQVDSLH